MLQGTSASPGLPWGLQAVGAMLARLEVRVGLGVDLGRVFDVAERLGLRLVRVDPAGRRIAARPSSADTGTAATPSSAPFSSVRRGNFCSDIWILLLERGQSTSGTNSTQPESCLCDSTAYQAWRFRLLDPRIVANIIENHSQLDDRATGSATARRRTSRALMPDPRRNRFKTYAGVLVSVLLAALAGWVLWRTFQRIRFADVLAQMQAVPASTLALAGAVRRRRVHGARALRSRGGALREAARSAAPSRCSPRTSRFRSGTPSARRC